MITCFLIDDDPDDHDFFKIALSSISPGIKLHIAHNGCIGLNMLPSLNPPPDVIFLDLNMPVLGGLEFLDEFKQTPFKHIPVVVYSTSDESFFKQRSIERGAAAYLTKAFTMTDLVKGITNQLNQLSLQVK